RAPSARAHSSTSAARTRSAVGIVGLIYERLRWGCARDLVLRFGREIAGVMSFVQLFFKRPVARLTIRPRLTAGGSPISFVQRVRFLYSCVCRNLRGSL